MPPPYWDQEWLDMNGQRRYPLASGASATDTTGEFTIPDNFLLGFSMPIHAGTGLDPALFYIMSLTVYPTGYNVVIGYGSDIVGAAVIAKSAHTRGASYAVVGRDDFDDAVGKIVIGETADIDALPAGRYTFAFAAGRLDPDCIVPMLAGVSGITVVNGTERSEKLYGDIELIAGNNIQLSVVGVGEFSAIRIDAISGAGLVEDCACSNDHADAVPIRTVNGIAAQPDGNFNITTNRCITTTGILNGIKLDNTCATPCCGCPELEALATELGQMGRQVVVVADFVTRLRSEQEKMQMMLFSRINDRGCIRNC